MNFKQLDVHLRKLNEMEYKLKILHNKYGKYLASHKLKEEFSNRLNNNNWTINSNCLMEKNKNISIHKHDRYVKFDSHKHDYIELIYVYSGKITQVINNKNLTINKGEICILDMNTTHSIMPASENDIAINILIKKEFFDSIILSELSDNNIISDFIIKAIYDNKKLSRYLYFKSSENAKVDKIMKNMLLEFYDPQFGTEAVIKAYMILLFTELFRNYHNDLELKSKKTMNKVFTIEISKFMKEHYADITINDLAKHLNFNPNYLSKLIKQNTGKSFTILLQNIRLEQACFRLKNTSVGVKNVAMDVGYSNTSYFYKLFKGKYGMTPDDYRKKND